MITTVNYKSNGYTFFFFFWFTQIRYDAIKGQANKRENTMSSQ